MGCHLVWYYDYDDIRTSIFEILDLAGCPWPMRQRSREPDIHSSASKIAMYDRLYGEIQLSRLTSRLLQTPELLRLRDVRLSNIDTWTTPAFANTSRYEHLCGVAFLTERLLSRLKLDKHEKTQILVAALYHDIATPAFGHTLESVLPNYDHEKEVRSLLGLEDSPFNWQGKEIHAGYPVQLPQLLSSLKQLGGISLEQIVEYICGKGQFGFLINGVLDLDNLDNVVRAGFYCGLTDDAALALRITDALDVQEGLGLVTCSLGLQEIKRWVKLRNDLYRFWSCCTEDVAREATLAYTLTKANQVGLLPKENWYLRDSQLIYRLSNCSDREVQTWINRYLAGITLPLICVGKRRCKIKPTESLEDLRLSLLRGLGFRAFIYCKCYEELHPHGLIHIKPSLFSDAEPPNQDASFSEQVIYVFATERTPVKWQFDEDSSTEKPFLNEDTKKRCSLSLKTLRKDVARILTDFHNYEVKTR